MKPKVVIADYGVSNLLSVLAAFQYCGADCVVTNDAATVQAADRLILPGVGAFGNCMDDVRAHDLVEPILQFATTGRPLFGICVGMQMLLDESEEFGQHKGLGLISGSVVAIPARTTEGHPQRIPHIGWNALRKSTLEAWSEGPFCDLEDGSALYFVHSFHAVPTDAEHLVAQCVYGGHNITAAIQRDNVFGCQFHPERSGPVGLGIISQFLNL